MKQWIVGLLFMLGHYSHAQTKCTSQIPADICTFEDRVYTETNFKNTQELRQLLVDFKSLLMKHVNDPALIQDRILTLGNQIVEESYNQRAPKKILAMADGKKNLLDMLKHLRKWEAKNGQIVPLDWQLPSEFVIGVTAHQRTYNSSTDRLRFAVQFFSILDKPVDIEQFQLSRYGGAVLIDKNADIGDWKQGTIARSHRPYISTSSAQQDTPFPDGLYLISLKLKGQKKTDGWFFLHGASTTNPAIMSPQVNEKLTTTSPTFKIQDFTSSFTSKADSRKLTLSVSQESDYKEVWNTSYINPVNKTSITLGQDENQFGPDVLSAGAYQLNVTFEERSYFGDLTIGRVIRTTVPFGIAK